MRLLCPSVEPNKRPLQTDSTSTASTATMATHGNCHLEVYRPKGKAEGEADESGPLATRRPLDDKADGLEGAVALAGEPLTDGQANVDGALLEGVDCNAHVAHRVGMTGAS
mmetsp:Transcript_6315/g.18169  ORF Transcript_6315/g.18169 Transcript_6315/m.18169 type:complete len:111 (+) Transcript_6315:1297-1629(+)